MSTEYIERGALIAFVRGVRQRLPKDSKDFFTRDEMLLNFQQYIECQPAADVEPVVHAHWDKCELFGWKYFKCTNCGETISGFPMFPYCPNCGAHMDERSDA